MWTNDTQGRLSQRDETKPMPMALESHTREENAPKREPQAKRLHMGTAGSYY